MILEVVFMLEVLAVVLGEVVLAELLLDEADLAEIDAAYAPPRRKLALQML